MPPEQSKTAENPTFPRQFARRKAPDPMAFLLPDGHQRATRSASRTSLRENPLGRALRRSATTNWRGRFQTVPHASHRAAPAPPIDTLQCQVTHGRSRTTRAHGRVALTDRSLHQAREHSARNGGPPVPTTYETILGALASGEPVPLLQADRRRHVYVIGMTGTGKTGLLLNMMHADLMAGAGFCFLDPHGDASQHIASLAPRERRHDVIYLDPSDPTHTFAYNPLASVPEAERATAAANIISAFKNIWSDSWGPRLEYILGHSLRLLLDTKDQTLLGLPRLLIDADFRERLVRGCIDPVVRSFWQTEYAAYDPRLRNEAIAPIQNKIGAFLANPFIRSILCQN